MVAFDDTAPVVPPHVPKPAALAPHLRKLLLASTTQVVESDDVASVLPPHLCKPALAPHLRKPALTMLPHLHGAATTKVAVSDDAVPTLAPHLRLLDLEQVNAKRDKEYQDDKRKGVSKLSHDLE